jgi:hypothetical protein
MAYRRYRYLVEEGYVNNRATLKNRIKNNGFPPGVLLGPNDRAWTDEELADYVASRPTAPKQTPTPSPTALPRRRQPKT